MFHTKFAVPIWEDELLLDTSDLYNSLDSHVRSNQQLSKPLDSKEDQVLTSGWSTNGDPNFRILEHHPGIKLALLSQFNRLYYESTGYNDKFAMTTSWIVKTGVGDRIHRHKHVNCAWSGVLYFGEYDDGSGPLCLENPITHMMFGNIAHQGWQQVQRPNAAERFSFTDLSFKPYHNLVLYFPAALFHYTEEIATSDLKDRYSLAFNMVEDVSDNNIVDTDSYLDPKWLVE